MDFAGKADRSAHAGESALTARADARALAANLRLQADHTLSEVGRDAVSYLLGAGVEPVPVGRILQPRVGFKKERFEQTGREWAIAPIINLFLSHDGSWTVYQMQLLRAYEARRGPLEKAYGANSPIDPHLYPVDPTPLNGDCFKDGSGFVRGYVPHCMSSRVEHPTSLTFDQAGRLTIEEPMKKAMDFSDWVAERVGQLAARR